jgi:hypothetical protein
MKVPVAKHISAIAFNQILLVLQVTDSIVFEVLMVVRFQMLAFWDVMSRNLTARYHYFKRMYCSLFSIKDTNKQCNIITQNSMMSTNWSSHDLLLNVD